MRETSEITGLLQQGDDKSLEKLFPIVYDELRVLAGALFRGEFRSDHTLQPTALVHEAYLRLIGDFNDISWQNRALDLPDGRWQEQRCPMAVPYP